MYNEQYPINQIILLMKSSAVSIPPDKSVYPHSIFLISPQKHMLWVLIRSTWMRWRNKKTQYFSAQKSVLSGAVSECFIFYS